MPVSTLLNPELTPWRPAGRQGALLGILKPHLKKTLVKAYFLIFLMLRNLRLSARRHLTVVMWFSIAPWASWESSSPLFITENFRGDIIQYPTTQRIYSFFFLREYILKKSEIHFFPNLLHKPHISDEASLPKLGVGNFVKNLQSIHLFTWQSKSGGGVTGNKPETSMNNICLQETK